MAGYSRQESFSNGDVIDAQELNNEYDQLAVAFDKDSGHVHDGSDGNGDFVPLIKDKATDTSVNAGTDTVTVNISGNTDVFSFTRGGGGEAYLNGYNMDQLQTDLDSKYSASNQPEWDDIQNKPSIAPGLHNHTISEIDGLQTELDEKYSADNPPPAQAAPDWADIQNKPTNFEPIVHSVSRAYYNPASFTVAREGRYTHIVVPNGVTRTYTLDEETFLVGDIVEIDVLTDGGAVTVVTDTGIMLLPDGSNSNSHVLTNRSGTIRLYKHDTVNWSIRMIA